MDSIWKKLYIFVCMEDRHESIEKVFSAIKSGDQRAFERVFRMFYVPLCDYAAMILGEQAEAEDVVQDLFMHIWRSRVEIEVQDSVKSYLFTSVRFRALNVLKHRKIEQHYVNEILQDEDAELYYMRSVIEEETRRLIFTAIDSLPEHCRKVCLLNLEGMDNQEIADELQVSLNTVKFHKKNAYKLLRDKLKDQFYLLFLI